MEREGVQDRIKVDRPRCPFCHDDVERGADVAVCRDCDAKHHEECWPVDGRCGACGGGTALRAAPAPSSATAAEPSTLEVLPVDDVPAAARDLSAARWAFADTMDVLQRARRLAPYPWWMLLIPLCWPLVWARDRAHRARVRELVEHARYVARKHGLDITAEDEGVLREATLWAYR